MLASGVWLPGMRTVEYGVTDGVQDVDTPEAHTFLWPYTGCPRRKGPNLGRMFLRSNYTDITQNTYIQSSMVTEILNIEK